MSTSSLRLKCTIGAAVVSMLALAGAAQAADAPKIGVDLTTLTSPFWTSYNKYIVDEAKAQGLELLEPFNSEFDTAKQITGVKNSITLGAKGIIFSPFDTSAAKTVLDTAAAAGVKVVSVDVAPDTGPVAIVVRANNVAYGEKSCKYIGEHVAEGPVEQIMGDQASINGRDRGNGFRDCITKNYPKLKLLEIPTKAWSGEDAAAGLDTILNSTPDLKAIYMHAGGVFLAPTLQTLKRRGLLHPAGEAGHIVIVSNDGIPQEFDAIRRGEADATVSQPADLYAKYGLMYLKAAIEGKTFAAGPTDHDSTIVEVAPGVLEDQLSAPLVTKENVDDKAFWGNNL
jgi:ribose transport system substrate-binding protein